MPPRKNATSSKAKSQPKKASPTEVPSKRASVAPQELEQSGPPAKRVKTSQVASQNVNDVPSTTAPGSAHIENVAVGMPVSLGHSPYFAGNFDIYSMELSFLSEVYVNKAGSPKFEELHKKILTFQAKDDRTAQVYLTSPTKPLETSKFKCWPIQDPMESLPYDIVVDSIGHHEQLKMPSLKFPSGLPDTLSGISALMSIANEGCGIASSNGTFHLRRIWTKAANAGELLELFEGYISFNTSFSGLYRRKGHGPGQKYHFSFWAVRARVDEKGYEVGLVKGVVPTAVSANGEEPAKHPIAARNPLPPSPPEDENEDEEEDDEDEDEDWMGSRYGRGHGHYDAYDSDSDY